MGKWLGYILYSILCRSITVDPSLDKNMIYIIILTPLVILLLVTKFYTGKLLNYAMSKHPTLITGIGKVRICDQELELQKINDNNLISICAKKQMLMRLSIGYVGIAFMLIVFYWVYLIL